MWRSYRDTRAFFSNLEITAFRPVKTEFVEIRKFGHLSLSLA